MTRNDRTDKSKHPKCAQCGNDKPTEGFTTVGIIHQGRNLYSQKKEVQESTYTVCNGTGCGGHLQMAHEG